MKGSKKSQWNNLRCGSVFTAKIGGVSLYGYIEKFLRVTCQMVTSTYHDFALVKWFPQPQYPDEDPLWAHIDLTGSVTEMSKFLFLDQIDPSRILYELDGDGINPMRMEGIDLMPGVH